MFLVLLIYRHCLSYAVLIILICHLTNLVLILFSYCDHQWDLSTFEQICMSTNRYGVRKQNSECRRYTNTKIHFFINKVDLSMSQC